MYAVVPAVAFAVSTAVVLAVAGAVAFTAFAAAFPAAVPTISAGILVTAPEAACSAAFSAAVSAAAPAALPATRCSVEVTESETAFVISSALTEIPLSCVEIELFTLLLTVDATAAAYLFASSCDIQADASNIFAI